MCFQPPSVSKLLRSYGARANSVTSAINISPRWGESQQFQLVALENRIR
jgi:hypothetical protein